MDYEHLTFPPGPMTSTMTYRVFLIDDQVPEPQEAFQIALNNSNGIISSDNELVIFQQDRLEVIVKDDDSEQLRI